MRKSVFILLLFIVAIAVFQVYKTIRAKNLKIEELGNDLAFSNQLIAEQGKTIQKLMEGFGYPVQK